MYNGYWGNFKGVKCLGCDSDQAPPSTTKVGIISLLRPCTNVMWTGMNVVVVVIVVVVVVVIIIVVVVAVHVPVFHRRG